MRFISTVFSTDNPIMATFLNKRDDRNFFFGFGPPYSISVLLKGFFYMQWNREQLSFRSYFLCSIPELATTEASMSRTYMSFSVGMSCTGASQISTRFVFYQRLLEPFHSTQFFPFDHFFCIPFHNFSV